MIPMKKLLLALSVLSLAFVGCSKKDDSATLADKTKAAADTAVDKTKETATDVKNAISDKLTEWKLTPSDIKADLEKGGRIVRKKTVAAGERSCRVGLVMDVGLASIHFTPMWSFSPRTMSHI